MRAKKVEKVDNGQLITGKFFLPLHVFLEWNGEKLSEQSGVDSAGIVAGTACYVLVAKR